MMMFLAIRNSGVGWGRGYRLLTKNDQEAMLYVKVSTEKKNLNYWPVHYYSLAFTEVQNCSKAKTRVRDWDKLHLF